MTPVDVARTTPGAYSAPGPRYQPDGLAVAIVGVDGNGARPFAPSPFPEHVVGWGGAR